jgi:hypothetical protein
MLTVIFFAFGFSATLNSCAPEQPRGKGTLEVKIKDHRAAIDDFAKLDIPIEGIRIKPSGSWIEAKPEVASIDLTAYRKGHSITVYKGELEAGVFEGFHLKLGKIAGVLKKNQSQVETKNSVGPIQLAFSVDPRESDAFGDRFESLGPERSHGTRLRTPYQWLRAPVRRQVD